MVEFLRAKAMLLAALSLKSIWTPSFCCLSFCEIKENTWFMGGRGSMMYFTPYLRKAIIQAHKEGHDILHVLHLVIRAQLGSIPCAFSTCTCQLEVALFLLQDL